MQINFKIWKINIKYMNQKFQKNQKLKINLYLIIME